MPKINIFLDTNCLALYGLDGLETLCKIKNFYIYTSWFVIKEIIAQLNDIIRGIDHSITKIKSRKAPDKSSEAVIEAIKQGTFCGQSNKQFEIIGLYKHIVEDSQHEIVTKAQLEIYCILKKKFESYLDGINLILCENSSIKINVLRNDENSHINRVFNDYFNGIDYKKSGNGKSILCKSKYYDSKSSRRKRMLSGDITDRFIAEHFTTFFVDAPNVTAIFMTKDSKLKNYFFYWLKTNGIYNNCIVTDDTTIDNEYVSTWYRSIDSIIANHELFEYKTQKDALTILKTNMEPLFIGGGLNAKIMGLCFDQMVATGIISKQGEDELGVLYLDKKTRLKSKLEKIREELKEGKNPFL